MNPDPKAALDYFQSKMAFTTVPVELERALKHPNVQVVDVRAADDYADGHIPGAIALPQDRWDTFASLSRDKTNVLPCYLHVCHLAANAAVKFAEADFPVMEMDGGMRAWRDSEPEVGK